MIAWIDPHLMRRAEPHFRDAFATYGMLGAHPYDVARRIAEEAELAGFAKPERRNLLEYLFAYVDARKQRDGDLLLLGEPVPGPRSLFSLERLGGLFRAAAEVGSVTQDLFAPDPAPIEERERALIEQLIAATRLYETSGAVMELLGFIAKLRGFAPFNAMLLHIQKPGLTHAATAADWHRRFGRVPKRDARPLMVLRTMGPVDFVFDILDTVGRDLPAHAFTFPTLGSLSRERLDAILHEVQRGGVAVRKVDTGDGKHGSIRLVARADTPKGRHRYEMTLNQNHPPPTQLTTVAHELAHLHLGHLGADKGREIKDRSDVPHARREVEAETAAYVVAKRNGLEPKSESYLSMFRGAIDDIDLYTVMRAANAVEAEMGVAARQLRPAGVA